MLYLLYKFFNINFFSYITVRSGVAFFIAFFLTAIFMPKFIAWAKLKKANQPIYELAPSTHKAKNQTPTMGGIVYVISAVIASLICMEFTNLYAICGVLCLVFFCFLGYKDDFAKVSGGKNHDGFTARKKFGIQLILSLILSLILYQFGSVGSNFYLPFYKYPVFDFSIFVVLFWTLVITASSNAVNLTDGLDGLASVPSIFALLSLGIFAYFSGHAVLSSYLLLPKISGVGEISILIFAMIGALLGFLWYNCHPAQVFMGDSGSLATGAFIGYCGVITKNELLLVIIGFIFVMETLSVILQVGSFKMFKKRIFLMTPIHHHFELKGWVENKIIVRFWIIALIANIIALISLKLR